MDAVAVEHAYMGRLVQWSMTWNEVKATAEEGMGGIRDLDLDELVGLWVMEGGTKVSTR